MLIYFVKHKLLDVYYIESRIKNNQHGG